jgi:predicted nucleic acid-binding protein
VNLLDTDALSHLQKNDPVGTVIAIRLVASADPDFRITTVSVYEMLSGAFDLIHQLKKKHKDLIPGFQLFQELFDFLGFWRGRILPYDQAADQVYRGFPPRLRQDLGNDGRIAAIALARGAAVWTCNVGDFKRVPGLIVYRAETGLRVT